VLMQTPLWGGLYILLKRTTSDLYTALAFTLIYCRYKAAVSKIITIQKHFTVCLVYGSRYTYTILIKASNNKSQIRGRHFFCVIISCLFMQSAATDTNEYNFIPNRNWLGTKLNSPAHIQLRFKRQI
jgi:hypothetical protein